MCLKFCENYAIVKTNISVLLNVEWWLVDSRCLQKDVSNIGEIKSND